MAATKRSQSSSSRFLKKIAFAVVHGLVRVVHEVGLVEPPFHEGHGRLRPAQRAVEADLVRELLREVLGMGDGDGRVARSRLTGEA
jgi:hypothetical protein